MRGTDEASGSLFSYVDLEDRSPARHPLRKIRQIVNRAREAPPVRARWRGRLRSESTRLNSSHG